MIDFMLDAAGEQPVAFEGVFHSIKVLIGNQYPFRAGNIRIDPGKDTSFLIVVFIAGEYLTFGFAKDIGMRREGDSVLPSRMQVMGYSGWSASTTQNCRASPICWAVSPIPSALYMVEIMSLQSWFKDASNSEIAFPFSELWCHNLRLIGTFFRRMTGFCLRLYSGKKMKLHYKGD